MLHTKLIGRIALVLSFAILSGVGLVVNAAQAAANLPRINFPDTRSFNPVVLIHVVASLPLVNVWLGS